MRVILDILAAYGAFALISSAAFAVWMWWSLKNDTEVGDDQQ